MVSEVQSSAVLRAKGRRTGDRMPVVPDGPIDSGLPRSPRQSRRLAGLLLVAAAGCGQPVEVHRAPPGVSNSELDLFRSGSRLHAQVVLADGAPPLLLGFYDTELEVECDFRRVSDGSWRCLPRSTGMLHGMTYEDADCEASIWLANDCDGPQFQRTGLPIVSDECRSFQPYEVVDFVPLAPDDPSYERLSDGTCVLQPASERDDRPRYSSRRMPPSRFVGGEESMEAGATRLSRRVLRADDGTLVTLGLSDTRVERPCGLWETESGDWVCVSNDAATYVTGYGTQHDDPDCAGPALASHCADETPRATAAYSRARYCGMWFSGARSVGPERASDTQFQNWDECTQVDPPDTSIRLYEPGAPIADDTFATAELLRFGTGRLQLLVTAEADRPLAYHAPSLGGALVTGPLASYFDTRRGEQCSPADTAAGIRCVPTYAARLSSTLYADASCSGLTLATAGAGDCDGPLPVVATRYGQGADRCEHSRLGRLEEMRRVVEAYDGGDVYELLPGSDCAPPVELPYELNYLVLGDEVPLTDLAEMTLE